MGKIIGQNQQRHRSTEFRNFLDSIEKKVPEELDVHLILNNYAPTNEADPGLAGQTAPLPRALHVHLGLMAQSGRTLVRTAHRTPTPPQRPPLPPRNSKLPSTTSSNSTTATQSVE
jgi:hypothetical protein